MDKAEKDCKASLIMKVRRGIHTPYLEMEPAWEKPAAKN